MPVNPKRLSDRTGSPPSTSWTTRLKLTRLAQRTLPLGRYKAVPDGNQRNLDRVESNGSRKALLRGHAEPGASTSTSHQIDVPLADDGFDDVEEDQLAGSEDHEELLAAPDTHKSVYADVRGVRMLRYTEFYQYFVLMGLLTGIGLMSINNIGNDAQALWAAFDPSTTLETIRARQSIHVSVLSFCSFLGRLLSGIGADLIVQRYNLSRVWCLFASSLIFLLAQVCGLSIENPNLLFLLSGLTGLAYGFLFGCFPSTVAETFGVQGLSTNWGVLTLAPVIFANIFNLMYGSIYDSHSHVRPDHKRECLDGKACYHEAYWGTFMASILAADCVVEHQTPETGER